MIWFWTRDGQKTRIHTFFDNDTTEFVIAVFHPDGREDVERIDDIDVYQQRLIDLERQFEAQHWEQTGPPIVDPDGFPRERLPRRGGE